MTIRPPIPAPAGGENSARMSPRRRFNAWVALIAAVCVTLLGASLTWPPLPHVLRLDVTFPDGPPGQSEPIISTGEFSNGDLLVVKYQAEHRLVLTYDAWGAGGPSSTPIAYTPGRTYHLDVGMPAFYELPGVSTHLTAPLRVSFEDREVLNADVSFHRRESDQVYFGTNPIHGSTAALFHGTIALRNGHRLLGGPACYFSTARRVAGFFQNPLQILAVLLIGIGCGYLLPWLGAGLRSLLAGRNASEPRPSAPPHGTFALTAAIAVLAFTYVVTDGSFRLIYPESFGTFYDHQALSLLHGRLDVPEESLSGEAFIYHGKCYGYFGPTPALMRIPFALLGVGFGKLSRSFMLLDFGLCLVAIYALLIQAVRLRHGPEAWPTRWATVVFTAMSALGSTLFYLSSRAYIYHEAILCGAMFALWAGYCVLKYLEQPARRWWLGALICGTLSVHARPPVGLFALVLLGVAAAINLGRAALAQDRRSPVALVLRSGRKHLVIGVLSVLGVLSFNALSYLKFGTTEGCPLRYNVQYNPTRLARIDGKQFHWSNFHFGIDAYLLRPTLRVQKHFPYFATHGLDARDYPQAKLDMTEEMAGLPYAMPGLCLLALIGLAAWGRNQANRLALATVWVAIVPAAVAMFIAIAVAHRYTGDFVPFLIMAAAFGMAVVDDAVGVAGGVLKAFMTGVGLLSIVITAALTISYQGEGVWGVPDGTQEHYRALQHRVDTFFGVKPLAMEQPPRPRDNSGFC